MIVAQSIVALRQARATLTGRVGVVPTMGALHAGHLALVHRARAENDHVIVTIFVNPTQFGPNEDLDAYPRDLPGDMDKLKAAGVDCVFTPTPDMMYPPGFQTSVEVAHVSQGLEGAHRPGHFRGVATVVCKLFNLTQPTTAYFGQKDAQQVVVIRQMVRDLNMPLHIAVIPIARDTDGLALSSRNVYLTPAQRPQAAALHKALAAATDRYHAGERHAANLEAAMRHAIAHHAPDAVLDYAAVVDAATLSPVTTATADQPLLASLTVRFGTTRLLDNALLPAALNTQHGLTAALGVGHKFV